MSRPFVNFRPAEVVENKETYVEYYAVNPATGRLARKRIRLNHITNKKERMKYARLLCQAVNDRLFAGWNPFYDNILHGSTTMEEAMASFLKAKERTARPATMRSYRSYCSILAGWMKSRGEAGAPCASITKETLEQFMRWADGNKSLSNRSWNNYCRFLFLLFAYLYEKGYTAGNPAAGMEHRRTDTKGRTIIPKEERARIRAYFESHLPRFVPVMMLCYRLFIRPNEIVHLRIRDVDFKNSLLNLPPDVSKNHHVRVLAVPDEIMAYFRSIEDMPGDWFVFGESSSFAPSKTGMAATRISGRWAKMRRDLDLPESYQFYSLKDTGITEMLEAGVPAKYVKELADHHSLEMTERYTHRSEAKKILEWNRLEF